MNHLKNISTDGYDSTVAGVNELLEKKYLWRRACGGNSPGGWEYYVYQYPQLEDPFRNGNSPTREFPESGKPATSKERVEVVKKDLLSKDEDGFVADAPKTMAVDLFPTEDSNAPKPSNPQIAARSSMDSRPLQSTEYMARFKARANRLLGRRDTTAWSPAELRAAKLHLDTCEEDWQLLEKLYAKRGEKDVFTRQSMLTLLNNWGGEIDKARAMFPPPPQIPDEKLDPVAAGKYWANVKPNE
jgi:hypothetical protein